MTKVDYSVYKENFSDIKYMDEESVGFIDPETGLKAKYRDKTDLVTGGEIGKIRCIKKNFSKGFIDGTYEIFSGLIESFMKEGNDQFRDRIRKLASKNPNMIKMAENIRETGTNPYIEKRWQQRLFIHYKEKRNDKPWIFAYDLEFSQAYPNESVRNKLETNEPDLMAIQFNAEGIAEKLLLIEVKSTYESCWNEKNNKETGLKEHKSDLWEHVKGMKRYSDMSFLIRSRLDDAYRIMEQYSATGLYPVIGSAQLPSILSLDDKDVRRIILFTNNRLPEAEERLKKVKKKQSALDFLRDETMKKKLDKLISDEDPECEIWFTEDDYFSDLLKIKKE